MEREEGTLDIVSVENKTGFHVIESLEEQWFYYNILAQTDPGFLEGSRRSSMKEAVSNSPDIPAIQPHEEAARGGAPAGINGFPESVATIARSPSLPNSFGESEIDHRGESHEAVKFKNGFPPRIGTQCSTTKLPSMIRRPRLTVRQQNQVGATRNRGFKSLSDLEFEELKGFAELGFVFNMKKPDPDMVDVLRGLRRAGEETEESGGVGRPYLSEAWLGKRHDLLVLAIPSPKSEQHMKSHLKAWAKNVASVVKQGY